MYPIMMIIVGEWSVTNGIMGVNGTLYNVRDKHNIVNDSSPQWLSCTYYYVTSWMVWLYTSHKKHSTKIIFIQN